MSTPYTLIRGRVKNLMTCFNACKVDESVDRKPKTSSIPNDRNFEREKKQVKLETTPINGGEQESPSSWQSCESEEEDGYIVFYFQDDDAGDDVIECSSSGRKQNDITANRRKNPETRKRQVEPKPVPKEIKVSNECDEHKDTILEESSDSSTSSFAFPAIHREWTGSPVLMPRPEGHNKSRSVCVQCCKF